jgi:AbrB family looped-hinge helix DNA binding protein
MPPKKKVDSAKLVEAIESGKRQSEVMKEFNFKSATQLKSYYLNALIDTGKAPEIKVGRASSKAAPAKDVAVNKRGSVVIPKALVDEMGFAAGDKFVVRKTKAGISLKKIA